MSVLRTIDFNHPDAYRAAGYRSNMLYHGESAVIIASLIPAGLDGPATHVHTSDQYYFVVRGEITIQLGSEVFTVPQHGLIYIPAGTPHHNWNATGQDEVHVEVIAPGPRAGKPLSQQTEPKPATGYYTRALDESRLGDTGTPNRWGMTSDWLDTREQTGGKAHVYVANIPSGKSGPPLHVHGFDQFYFVLQGTLNVQVGLNEFQVNPDQLVVIPAGVPHRQWNAGDQTERHIGINAPAPPPKTPTKPWDIAVELTTAVERI